MRGYSTLVGVVIMLAFVSIIIVGISSLNLSFLQSSVSTQRGNAISSTIDSCIEESMIRLRRSLSFSGGVIPLSDTESCSVTISGDSSQKTIIAQVGSQGYIHTTTVTVSITTAGEAINFDIVSWESS